MKIIPFLLLFLFANNFVLSQDFLSVPDLFSQQQDSSIMANIYSGNANLQSISEQSTSQKYWLVYSDRADNITKKTNGQPGEKLNYLQPLFVLKVNQNKLLVADYESEDELGWIDVSKVLLSAFSITTNHTLKSGEQGKASIPKKAVILTGELKRNDKGEFSIDKYYYNSPYEQKKFQKGKPKVFQPLFVFKELNGFVLLGVSDFLDGPASQHQSKVLGWIPLHNIEMWNTRLALEPTNTQQAKKEYEGLTIGGFTTLNELKTCLYDNICTESKIVADIKIGPIRNSQMRKPIIEHIDQNIKKVISIAREQHDKNDLYRAMVEETNELMKKTNIIFVVDATASMTPYFKSVANSLQKVIDRNQKLLDSELKFSLIVYRDYADGEKAYEVIPLTSDVQSLKSKINSIRCMSKDSDLPEAQFNGMYNGIQSLNLNPKESNIVVLIGDCGNHRNENEKYDIDLVSELFYQNNINLISFQVKSSSDISYLTFNDDVKSILLKTAETRVSRKNSTLDVFLSKQKNVVELHMKSKSKDDIVNMFGLLKYATFQSSTPKELEELINTSLSSYISTLKNNINLINKWIYTGATGEDPPEGLILKLMEQHNLSREKIVEMLKTTELTTDAYVAIKYSGKNSPSQTPVVLLTESEKKKLVKSLRVLTEESHTSTEQKRKFQDNLIYVCQSIIGQNTSEELIKNLTLNQIWNIIMGVDFGKRKLGELKLKEVAEMKQKAFKDFYRSFTDEADHFCNESYYHSDNMKSRRFKVADSYLYWIPLEDLPACNSY